MFFGKQRFSFVAAADSESGDSDGDSGGGGDSSEEEEEEEAVERGDVDGVGMSEAEERLVARFMNAAPMQRRSLADIIMDKIREKENGEARLAGAAGEEAEDESGMPRLPPKVIPAAVIPVACGGLFNLKLVLDAARKAGWWWSRKCLLAHASVGRAMVLGRGHWDCSSSMVETAFEYRRGLPKT